MKETQKQDKPFTYDELMEIYKRLLPYRNDLWVPLIPSKETLFPVIRMAIDSKK